MGAKPARGSARHTGTKRLGSRFSTGRRAEFRRLGQDNRKGQEDLRMTHTTQKVITRRHLLDKAGTATASVIAISLGVPSRASSPSQDTAPSTNNLPQQLSGAERLYYCAWRLFSAVYVR